ncbi:MAG: hypothetical protein UV54_C0044G0014 [Candidatus Beckwithbacteria bacterium GW2011_GWA2_43_10]|uniref:Uncharacterized protein n=1 Tax=Candidatus Beckwithbacteria bacterium GW2011_GWA2_43_10 TaxID=1618369 RepID=A0A0G1C088_9BACT|nr:MAG: hypothetical protein UV54_C0044G0014 [Candidatus Beckwithbacteria bacterium GW2011_GWA2_43_10]
MLVSSHALIGASLARLIPNPVLGYPFALGCHFLADLVPHWDFRTRSTKRSKLNTVFISLIDAAFGLWLGWLIFKTTVSITYLFPMMLIAQLPDWLEGPYHIFDWNFPPFSSIKKLQSRLHRKQNLPWGLIWQILIVSLLVFYARAT